MLQNLKAVQLLGCWTAGLLGYGIEIVGLQSVKLI
jgi:hypothetical protein